MSFRIFDSFSPFTVYFLNCAIEILICCELLFEMSIEIKCFLFSKLPQYIERILTDDIKRAEQGHVFSDD